MRKKDRYMMREKGLPYYLEDVIIRTPVGLTMFEFFDGKEVKWGVREEFINIFDDRLCLSTPQFENMTDTDGKDLERVIYLGDGKLVFHGKLNGSEVFFRVNEACVSENDFYQMEDYGGKNAVTLKANKEFALMKYEKDGLEKLVFFNIKDFKKYSNEFDFISKENYFLKSYVYKRPEWGYPSKVYRLFMGFIDENGTLVKQYGYDFDKKEIIKFPLTEDGLIDDEKMQKYVENQKDDTSFKCYCNYRRYHQILSDFKQDWCVPKILPTLEKKNKINKK